MAYEKVGTLAQLDQRGMAGFFVEGVEVLIVRDTEGNLHAFDGLCPHQDSPLADGDFDGTTITCATHGWMFDARNGRGINPPNCRIAEYSIKIEGDELFVDLDQEIT